MFIKFFSRPKKRKQDDDLLKNARGSYSINRGGSPRKSMSYLLNKDEDHVRILAGNPEISKELAESLTFKNKYTVGCLTFEEENILEDHKYEIMQKFEDTFFAGLESNQYDISWIEHTDKGRLELNFFIPNVELSTQKRLQPYYHYSDLHLADNFKKVINLEYGLTSPDDPQKRQAVTINKNLPKNTKEIIGAINEIVTDAFTSGKIKNRKDVVEYLESSGFQIARQTEKYISIKNENGRNIRLRGAIYEQSFGVSEESKRTRTIETTNRRSDQTAREIGGFETSKRSSGALEEARGNLNHSIKKRLSDNQRYSRSRKTESYFEGIENLYDSIIFDTWRNHTSNNFDVLLRLSGTTELSTKSRMEAVGSPLQGKQQGADVGELHNEQQRNFALHQDRSSIQGSSIRRRSRLPNYQAREELNDTDREAFEGHIRQVSEAARRGYERIKQTIEQVRAREPTVEELARKVFRRIEVKLQKQALEKQKEAEAKQQRKLSRGRGLGM